MIRMATKDNGKSDRDRRLAEALRANLHRRKAQKRLRSAEEGSEDSPRMAQDAGDREAVTETPDTNDAEREAE